MSGSQTQLQPLFSVPRAGIVPTCHLGHSAAQKRHLAKHRKQSPVTSALSHNTESRRRTGETLGRTAKVAQQTRANATRRPQYLDDQSTIRTRTAVLHTCRCRMSSPVKIGLIGYGRAARIFHLPFITSNPNYILHAFYQRSPAPASPEEGKGTHCTVDYPYAKHYTDLDEFLADGDIDVVSIVTRHDTHSAFAEKALLAGKHGTSAQV